MSTEQDRIHKIHGLSLQAWQWYRDKAQIEPSKRDDYYWKVVTDDVKAQVEKVKDKSLRKFLKSIMIAYMNDLQNEFSEWLLTKQERLPI